jgi:hypothetical protein
MAEQTFKSPGFFENEIDLSQRVTEIIGVPAGVVGTSEMGPAFVPVTVGSFADFEKRFGSLDSKYFGPYAVREFLKHQTALTYVRVLGAGANDTATDISNTRAGGIVKSAGFKVIGSQESDSPSSFGRYEGCVQFIAARHVVSSSQETAGYPIFRDNRSYDLKSSDDHAFLIRGMLFTPTGSRFEILSYATASYATTSSIQTDLATPNSDGLFKLVLSSSAGSGFSTGDGFAGIRIYTASLNPVADEYIGNILNTDPERFGVEEHLLYADFPVENELASVDVGSNYPSIALMSGSSNSSQSAGISSISFLDAFGRFDTRYSAARTSTFISQPYGAKEFELFHFECISDGAVANQKYKISIRDLKRSSDPSNLFGTFTVQVRNFDDTDTNIQVIEQYSQCTLNPLDDDYVAKKIGDYKAYFNFDAEQVTERRMMVEGKYPNLSSRVRIVMNSAVENRDIPKDALPFGFRGFPALKTNDTLTDHTTGSSADRSTEGSSDSARRLTFVSGTSDPTGKNPWKAPYEEIVARLSGSIVPPVPMRFKVTRGYISTTLVFRGHRGDDERVDGRYYWGCKSTRLPRTESLADSLLNPNVSSEINPLIRSYTKLLGIQKLDQAVTGAGADQFNDNKFTLARVALPNKIENNSSGNPSLDATANSTLTGSAKEHLIDTAYIRNADPNTSNYTVMDPISDGARMTLASLAALTSSVYFNRFTNYAKFTNFMYGGFDGVNILNKDMARMNDKATSSDTGGLAANSSPDIGLNTTANEFGTGKLNSAVASYRIGATIITDPMVSRVNIVTIPGIRDGSLTDFVFEKLSEYSKAMYVVDIPSYDADSVRLFGETSTSPDVGKTTEQFDSRALDNNFSAAYFPDVTIEDPINNIRVQVPSSVAVIGALAYNDVVAYPWFAPAGFNRAALDFVTNVKVRLNQNDRDMLYEARINPIATFPQAGFVIFGQKTLQLARSALDRVNVRRMLLEVKRIIVDVANKVVFEQNTPQTRARFVAQVTPLLATVQAQQGVDQFKVVMDSSNNSQEDIENNVLNGKIVVVPTRAVEFVAIDFIITNAGVSFE